MRRSHGEAEPSLSQQVWRCTLANQEGREHTLALARTRSVPGSRPMVSFCCCAVVVRLVQVAALTDDGVLFKL